MLCTLEPKTTPLPLLAVGSEGSYLQPGRTLRSRNAELVVELQRREVGRWGTKLFFGAGAASRLSFGGQTNAAKLSSGAAARLSFWGQTAAKLSSGAGAASRFGGGKVGTKLSSADEVGVAVVVLVLFKKGENVRKGENDRCENDGWPNDG